MAEILFPELREALREALDASGQDEQFRRQITKLIENAYENNAERKDVERLLAVTRLDEEDGH